MDSSSSEFVQVVSDIKIAEKKSAEIRSNAETEAGKILKNAKEQVAKISSRIEESVVKRKNLLLDNGVKKIEHKVEIVVNGAKEDASKLKSRKLKSGKAHSLFDYILQ